MNISPHFSPRILTRLTSLFVTGAAIVVLLGFTAQKAYAHHVITTATVSCSTGSAVISYTATSWDVGSQIFPMDGENPDIQVFVNGVSMVTGTFTDPLDSFSGTLPFPLGTNTADVTAIAEAPWGDGYVPGQGESNTVTLTNPCPTSGVGRFTGGGKQITINDATGDPVAVTKGFEVDCDRHQPSNNLEVNWQDPAQVAHQFHMEVFTSAICELLSNPSPPPAPVNTIFGTGTGRFDGAEGYSIAFELQDNGEPGKGVDAASFMIYQTSNPSNVVLNAPVTFITGGNIQAHVDQH